MNGYWLNRPEKAESSTSWGGGGAKEQAHFPPWATGRGRAFTHHSVSPEGRSSGCDIIKLQGRGKRSGMDAEMGKEVGAGLNPSFFRIEPVGQDFWCERVR